ncbi:hypothetical protein VXQ18_09230 [Brucella abortus]|nr:hypothetical protein [Brucella abortus]
MMSDFAEAEKAAGAITPVPGGWPNDHRHADGQYAHRCLPQCRHEKTCFLMRTSRALFRL